MTFPRRVAVTAAVVCAAGLAAAAGASVVPTERVERDVCPADLNNDDDVGFGDVLWLLSHWGPCAGCPEDLNGSGVVDFADVLNVIGAWGPCGQTLPSVAAYSNSGCLPGDGGELGCTDDDSIELTVVGSTLYVLHRSTTYNCCPDDIVVSLTVEGNTLRLTETETFVGFPCPCLCCYDVEATITDIPPGSWTVEYCWDDYEIPGDRCHYEMIGIQ
ncbi:MAG: hypothetical protein GY715_03500 [Planctomycetes bacterium]|nr:hypothetical protein [Planctomycetota bacterium]